MCTVLLLPGDNQIAVNKYIDINNKPSKGYIRFLTRVKGLNDG